MREAEVVAELVREHARLEGSPLIQTYLPPISACPAHGHAATVGKTKT